MIRRTIGQSVSAKILQTHPRKEMVMNYTGLIYCPPFKAKPFSRSKQLY